MIKTRKYFKMYHHLVFILPVLVLPKDEISVFMKLQYRKSKSKEDSLTVAKTLAENFDIEPYALEELADVVKAGVRSNEIEVVPSGRSNVLTRVDEWFQNRLMPNTVSIPEEMYKQALYSAFRLVVLGNIAKTDFGSSRQRDFGQMLTDFTRGFLGEAATKLFFAHRFKLRVDLEEKEIGEVEQFLPTDIVKVWDNRSGRTPKINFSIKTSKLPSMWLDIAKGQLSHSDVFCFIKIGLTVDHFAIFLKDMGFIEKLVSIGKDVGEVKKGSVNKEVHRLLSAIPEMSPWPAYIAGYVTKEDFEKGTLEVDEGRATPIVVGGCGYFGDVETNKVEGLGDIAKKKYLASVGALRWSQQDWEYIVKNI